MQIFNIQKQAEFTKNNEHVSRIIYKQSGHGHATLIFTQLQVVKMFEFQYLEFYMSIKFGLQIFHASHLVYALRPMPLCFNSLIFVIRTTDLQYTYFNSYSNTQGHSSRLHTFMYQSSRLIIGLISFLIHPSWDDILF